MSVVVRILTFTVLLWPLVSAADCNGAVSCMARQDEQDETSLVQVKKYLIHATHRAETRRPSLEDLALEEGRKLAELIKNDSPEPAIELGAGSAEAKQFPVVMMPAPSRRSRFVTNGIQLPGMMVGSGAPPRIGMGAGPMPGMAPGMVPPMMPQVPAIEVVPGVGPGVPPAIPHLLGGTSTVATQMSPAPESPEKAARRAAENEAIAERAMENSVHKAQDEERAAMYAAKKAAALRAAAERAAAAESAAAQSEMLAADSFQNEAVRRAEAQRTHAQASAVKAVVQKAAAYQASAEQQSAAKRAAAARTAAESARTGLQHDAEERYRLGCGRRRCKMDDRYGMVGFGNGMLDPEDVRRQVRRHEDQKLDYLDEQEDEAADEGHRRFHHHHGQWSRPGGPRTQVYCNSFTCASPWSLRLHPEAIQCGPGGCIREVCCLGPPGGAPPVLGPGGLPPPGQIPVGAVPGGPPALSPFGAPDVPIGPPPGVVGPGVPPMGAVPVGPAVMGGVAPLQPAFSCHVGDAVTATWTGDNGQYRGEIQSINADNTISVSWLDGDTTYPQVAAAQVFKDGVACVSVPSGSIGAVSQGGITIISDGTQARPHCSWRTNCNWDAPTQGMCATSLCQASGYPGGSYLSGSNDMCTSSYTADPFHYFEADTSRFLMSNGGEGNEAMITASCSPMGGSVVAVATPPVLPVSNRVLPMA